MSQVSYSYFVYRNRGQPVLQLVERSGCQDNNGNFTFVTASAKIQKNHKDTWNPNEWQLMIANSLRDDEKGMQVMVANFSPFVMFNERTGQQIRICENKITTALPPRGKCEILVTHLFTPVIDWFKNPKSIIIT
jgi:hypothetical protein